MRSHAANRNVNSHRSAIYAYHEQVQGKPVGQHPRVCTLISGVFNKNPPHRRSTFIWNVEQVLNYLKTLPCNEDISDKMRTIKLTTLLALSYSSFKIVQR